MIYRFKSPNWLKTIKLGFHPAILMFQQKIQTSSFPHHSIHKSYIALFLLILLVSLIPSSVHGAVELQFFRGSYDSEAESIVLEWTTSYESRTAYYFIKRKVADSQADPEIINVVLEGVIVDKVDAALDGTTGAEYQVSDLEVQTDVTYEYSLWEMETNNVEPADPERAFVIQAAPEQTSTELGQSTPTSTPTQTATVDPKSTATATPDANATTEATATLPVTSTPPGEIALTTTPENADESATAESETGSQATAESPTSTPTILASFTPTPILEESAPAPTQTIAISTETPSTQGSVAEAAELPQEETYPEPESDAAEESSEYVPPLATNTPEPISQQEIQPIGSEAENELPVLGGQAVEQVDQAEINQNRLILWGGFIGSLLFFIAVMVGTILMYRQRNNGG